MHRRANGNFYQQQAGDHTSLTYVGMGERAREPHRSRSTRAIRYGHLYIITRITQTHAAFPNVTNKKKTKRQPYGAQTDVPHSSF